MCDQQQFLCVVVIICKNLPSSPSAVGGAGGEGAGGRERGGRERVEEEVLLHGYDFLLREECHFCKRIVLLALCTAKE